MVGWGPPPSVLSTKHAGTGQGSPLRGKIHLPDSFETSKYQNPPIFAFKKSLNNAFVTLFCPSELNYL